MLKSFLRDKRVNRVTDRLVVWLSIIIVMAHMTSAYAVMAGVPEPPRPGPLPSVWLGWNNDAFGGSIGKDMDDFRTNSFYGGARYQRFIFAADYSMLTDYRTSGAKHLRSDELTGTVGYEVIPDGTLLLGGESWFVVGVGLRIHGELGGESVQNRAHDALGYKRVILNYEEQKGSEGLMFVSGRWQLTNPEDVSIPVIGDLDAHRVGCAVEGSAMNTGDGAMNAKLGFSLVVVGVDAAGSIGIFQEWHTGHQFSQTARAVAENESGTWLNATTSAGGWFFEVGYNLTNNTGLGTVGWMWGRPPGRIGVGHVGVVEGLVGFYQGYAYGLQYRWHTEWLDSVSDKKASMILDYRCGQHPQQNWRGNSMIVRQPLVGVDWSLADLKEGFSCVPFVYAAVGVREERVVVSGLNPRFPKQGSVSGVAQGGIGLRMFFGGQPTPSNPARYGLSVVYDGWLPFHQAEAVSANGRDVAMYQKPGAGFGLRLAASVLW